jgi:hypothetical protein
MKKKEWNEGLNYLDPDLVEKHIEQKEKLRQKKQKMKGIWLRFGAIAACFLLIVSAVIVVPMLREDYPGVIPNPGTTDDDNRPNIPIVNVQVPSYAPQYYGSESSVNSSPSFEQADIVSSGISVTARFVEALPDTYTFFDDWRQVEFRLLRMEVITVLEGAKMTEEFLFIVPDLYMTDYSIYDKLVFIDIAQYGYEYSLVYNKTQGCAEQLEMVLFGYMNTHFSSLGIHVMAFDSDDLFDMRLWNSTEGWVTSTHYTVEYFGTEYYQNYTLQDAEEEARNSGHGEDYYYVHSLADVNGESAETLDYIKSFENGVYVTTLGGRKLFYDQVQLGFRRYINGFATNENGMIYADSVNWSNARFSKEDEQNLPDLQAAVAAVISTFEAGEIKPPHLQNANQEKLKSSSVFGWYAKTANGVIGVVRVSWYYEDRDLSHYYDGRYFDDAYYIIEYGSNECVPIDKDALSDRIGADYEKSYIFAGEYDEYGKVRDMQVPMP